MKARGKTTAWGPDSHVLRATGDPLFADVERKLVELMGEVKSRRSEVGTHIRESMEKSCSTTWTVTPGALDEKLEGFVDRLTRTMRGGINGREGREGC